MRVRLAGFAQPDAERNAKRDHSQILGWCNLPLCFDPAPQGRAGSLHIRDQAQAPVRKQS